MARCGGGVFFGIVGLPGGFGHQQFRLARMWQRRCPQTIPLRRQPIAQARWSRGIILSCRPAKIGRPRGWPSSVVRLITPALWTTSRPRSCSAWEYPEHLPTTGTFGRLDLRRCFETRMSIYATLWKLKFPQEGDDFTGCDWIELTAQGVPAHIGSPSPGAGYESGDPFGAFLPPPVAVDSEGNAPHMRAVVFITELTQKGTERSGQEYQSPLLVLTGEEYDKITFTDLYERICSALRGNRAPVIAQIIFPDGSTEIIRHRPKSAE